MAGNTSDAVRKARNESVRRERNERAEAHNAVVKWVDPPFADWTCECANENCSEPVRLTIEEYEAIRDEPTHFVIAPSLDHVGAGIERIVRREDRYWVVEKVGVAAEVSEDLEPHDDD
jgi:hypothetical protein